MKPSKGRIQHNTLQIKRLQQKHLGRANPRIEKRKPPFPENTVTSDPNENTSKETGPPAKLEVPQELKTRARELFAKGAEVAYALNYDYAIELYLDGLSSWPEAVEEGHKPLREIALRRQAAGKKKAGFGDSSRFRKITAKTGKEAMLKAEYLISNDPANTSHMRDLIEKALSENYRQTAHWMADILFETNRQAEKPALKLYVFLRDAYSRIESYVRALQACNLALQLKPNDDELQDSMRDLSAQAAMQQGQYDKDTDFRDSIKDREAQDKQQHRDLLVQSEQSRAQDIADARAEYEAEPQHPGKINSLVAALCATEKTAHENEAVQILEAAYAENQQFQFHQRANEIKIRQLNRAKRLTQEELKKEPQNAELQEKLRSLVVSTLRAELIHYKQCTEQYPTDMSLKYEYGRRLLRAKQYDEAIPRFQEARNDPKLRNRALGAIGQCFFYKKWYADAVETFQEALDGLERGQDETAKEMRYNLGRAYEADGKNNDALACFRKIAQMDFNYRDVRSRIGALRELLNG